MADDIGVSIIVAAELRYGCAKKGSSTLLRRVEQFMSAVPVLPFDAAYGAIRAALEKDGVPIGRKDLLIAAHAQALDATVVTANVGEFGRVAGLRVENWLA